MSRTPRVELLYWLECPSWRRALADLERAMSEAGLDPGAIEMREVNTDAEAEAIGFLGSPSIWVDGDDVEPGPEGAEPAGLACRVYRRGDRVSPLPDPAAVRAALARSAAGG